MIYVRQTPSGNYEKCSGQNDCNRFDHKWDATVRDSLKLPETKQKQIH